MAQGVQSLEARIAVAVAEIAEEELAWLRDQMSRPYPPSGPPGGFPARRSGELVDGLVVEVSGLNITFASTAAHADFVEFGTERMEPRPFLRLQREHLAETFAARLRAKLGG